MTAAAAAAAAVVVVLMSMQCCIHEQGGAQGAEGGCVFGGQGGRGQGWQKSGRLAVVVIGGGGGSSGGGGGGGGGGGACSAHLLLRLQCSGLPVSGRLADSLRRVGVALWCGALCLCITVHCVQLLLLCDQSKVDVLLLLVPVQYGCVSTQLVLHRVQVMPSRAPAG